MHPHEEVVRRLYESFAKRDADGMARCYHADARFSDPVFPDLRGAEVSGMWRMLLTSTEDLDIALLDAWADGERGTATWRATYPFGKARRRVENQVRSTFAFRDGLIVHQTDAFDLWRWTRMALGARGVLLGWSPLVRRRVRAMAARRLARQMGGPR